MFDQLTDKFSAMLGRLKGQGKITEKNIEDALRDVRMALLEADVHVRVVKEFTESVKAQAVGQAVVQSITPAQQFVKIVHDTLARTMGESQAPFALNFPTPIPIMMVGLQGSGKTTTSAKLAQYLHKQGRRPYLIPADVSRPAAIEQLSILGKRIGIPAFPTSPQDTKPHTFVPDAVREAKKLGRDIAIVDTAGRLHVDAELMDELVTLKKKIEPKHILLVVDAMTGQDAVKVASAFHHALGLSGVILTKLDGDARGGAALSIKAVCGVPIFFAGMGEGVDELEPFHPDRIASRILDRGDIVSLVEKAQAVVDEKDAARMQEKFLKNKFDLEDFREQLKQMKKLGSIGDLLGHLPGAKKIAGKLDIGQVSKDLVKKEAILDSMTRKERRNPEVLNGKRRLRIARGSGTHPSDVNRLLKEFDQMRAMMKQFKKGGLGNLKQMLRM